MYEWNMESFLLHREKTKPLNLGYKKGEEYHAKRHSECFQ